MGRRLVELLSLWHRVLVVFGAASVFRLHLLPFLELLNTFLQFLYLVLVVPCVCYIRGVGLSYLLCSMLVIQVTFALLGAPHNRHLLRLGLWHF